MADVEHNSLTGSALHEMKGAASAAAQRVPVADGAGGTTFKFVSGGVEDYNDAATASTPITLVGGVWTPLTNDGAGSFTNLTYAPGGITSLMDTSTGKIDPTELNLGDVIIIRNDFTVTPGTNNQVLELRYTLGTGGASYTLESRIFKMDSGGSVPYRTALSVDMIYMGDGNTRDNLIGIEIMTTGAGTVVNAGTAITLLRYVG